MNQEAKDYLLKKYGEETLKGVENGTIFINDGGLNELMPKRTFTVKLDDINREVKWEDIIPKDWTLGDMPEWMKCCEKQVISEDFFIPVKEEAQVDYYRWNFNHKVGDIVMFVDGAFDEYNSKFMYYTLKPELKTKQGIVTDVYSPVSAWSNGASWVCKVDFDGKLIETLCGFFEKV